MNKLILFFFGLILVTNSGLSQNPRYQVDTFQVIYNYIAEVDTDTLVNNIRHLQQYGTRDCLTPQAVDAQNWIKARFENYGLPVELQSFSLSGGGVSSDNVIAIKTGAIESDKYVIIGGHYDSYTNFPEAPGADDNASGTCGVMEVARILNQYEFKRTIIFCAFSAEEYGLAGSIAYVSRCKQEGMDILGYFNLDMISYQKPGEELHSDMIAPPSAIELVNFYKGVAAIYLPGFPIYDGMLSGGDSDHTSFNNQGYMGIFPFEDDADHSPYIHTPADTIGTSVNSLLLAGSLTQAGLAAVATLAIPYDPVVVPEKSVCRKNVSLYPNPTDGRVNVFVNSPVPVHYALFTIHGQKVMEGTISKHLLLDVSPLATGTYALKTTGNDFIEIERLIIK